MSEQYDRGYEAGLSKAYAEGASAVEAMQSRIDNARNLVLALIKASGGEVFVAHGDIVHARADNYDLVQEENLEMDGWVFRIHRKGQ